MPDLNWNAVYGFWLVATHGSFANAARTLPRGSIQALHKRVQNLEKKENLNLKLFQSRGVKGVQLTEAGLRLKEIIDPIFRSFDLLATDLRGEASGSLKVAMTGNVAYNYGTPLISRFHREFPEVCLELLERPMLEAISLTEQGQVDVGIGSPPLGNTPLKIVGRAPMRLEFLAARNHPLARRKTVTWEDIAKESLILPERGTRVRHAFDSVMLQQHADAHTKIRVVAEVTGVELTLVSVKAGLGIALVPMGPRLMKNISGLRRITPPPGLAVVDVCVFLREDRYVPRFMKRFLELATAILHP